ncbi:MAG: sulfotransferase family 2 domain-containing protein [Chloroflexi bacterium]|nr:sulfotransferase family 2 domain-containing protein [Chloroflexota bacterium]
MSIVNQHETLIFLHIPKTAGTTLRQVVGRQFVGKPQYLIGSGTERNFEAFLALPEDERARLRYVGGHLRYGVHRFIPKPARYITMLRDPREHLISYYHYFLEDEGSATQEMIVGKTFEEFLQIERMQSIQLDLIVGLDDTPNAAGRWGMGRNRSLPVEQRLQIAERHLREHFVVVGLVERFDESMLLLRQRLGWKNVQYARLRETQTRPKQVEDKAPLHALVEQYAQPDLALYAIAKRIFEEQAAQYDGDLSADLAEYRQRNARFARLWTLSQSLRQTGLYRTLRKLLR